MNFTGTIVEIKEYRTGNPSILVRSHHDPTILTWAEWQSDLKGKPELGKRCRITTFGPLKIAV